MEEQSNRMGGLKNPFSALTSNLNIRSKLMLAFLVMIVLTIAVIVIATVSERQVKKEIGRLVQGAGKVSRLSLDTDKDLKEMQNYEKDFLLNYNKIGFAEAKKQYLSKFISIGGDAYQKLYEIQKVSEDATSKEKAQTAVDAINSYIAAFVSTANSLELRVSSEFGELGKMQQSVDTLRKSMSSVDSAKLQSLFQNQLYDMQQYMLHSDQQASEKVLGDTKTFINGVKGSSESTTLQTNLIAQTDEFTRWFDEMVKTDDTINSRIQAYHEAIRQADPVIASFLQDATTKENNAVSRMENIANLAQMITLGVGLIALVLGILLAYGLSKGLTGQIDRIMGLLGEMGMGNFAARTEVVSQDELGEMAQSLNGMLDNITTLIQSQDERDSIQGSIMKLMGEIIDLTDGDLTARAEVTEDITGAIADSFNTMAEQFGQIVSQVKEASYSVDATAADVSKLTSDLAEKSLDQTNKIDGAIKNINTIAESIRQVSQNAARSAEVSNASRSNAREGAEAVEKTNLAMDEIREQINETARSIKRLGESSMEIGNVVEIINTIADRTSILALNASIQAAMAGDAGYGFAVVAEEVQRLAESSSNSTKQIDLLVRSIQSEIKDVSNRMDESISKVVQGSQLADGAYNKLQEIEKVSNQLADLIESITQAAAKQVQMSEDVVQSMVSVGGMSTETSVTSQETAVQMNLLNATAQQLLDAVEAFKVEGAQAG